MSTPKVGYTHAALQEYSRIKPWSKGLDPNRLGTIKKDMPSSPGTVMVQWEDSPLPQQVALNFIEEK